MALIAECLHCIHLTECIHWTLQVQFLDPLLENLKQKDWKATENKELINWTMLN